MRYDLVNHNGTRLGEVMLAEGVTLQQANLELVDPHPKRLVPQQGESAKQHDDKKAKLSK